MVRGPFYRAGNALVSQDGTMVIEHRIVSDGMEHRSHFRVHMPARPVVEIEKAASPEEYGEFLALFANAQKLTAVLDQQWQDKMRRWSAQDKERELRQ